MDSEPFRPGSAAEKRKRADAFAQTAREATAAAEVARQSAEKRTKDAALYAWLPGQYRPVTWEQWARPTIVAVGDSILSGYRHADPPVPEWLQDDLAKKGRTTEELLKFLKRNVQKSFFNKTVVLSTGHNDRYADPSNLKKMIQEFFSQCKCVIVLRLCVCEDASVSRKRDVDYKNFVIKDTIASIATPIHFLNPKRAFQRAEEYDTTIERSLMNDKVHFTKEASVIFGDYLRTEVPKLCRPTSPET